MGVVRYRCRVGAGMGMARMGVAMVRIMPVARMMGPGRLWVCVVVVVDLERLAVIQLTARRLEVVLYPLHIPSQVGDSGLRS